MEMEYKADRGNTKTLNGVYIFPNGDKYDGEYAHRSDGSILRSGYGVNVSIDGLVCDGYWENDKLNGRGKITHPSGAVYEGEMQNNTMHGQGRYTFIDQSTYEGNFNENRMEGDGKFTDISGQVWCGQFNNRTASGLEFQLKM